MRRTRRVFDGSPPPRPLGLPESVLLHTHRGVTLWALLSLRKHARRCFGVVDLRSVTTGLFDSSRGVLGDCTTCDKVWAY